MKISLLSLFSVSSAAMVALALAAPATDSLTGQWKSTVHNPDGTTRESSLWLKDSGSTLTGYYARGSDTPTPISEGKATPDGLSFVIVTDNFGEMRRAEWSGTRAGTDLLMTPPSNPGRPRTQLTMKRISTDEPKPLPPPPLKVSLPAPALVPANGLAQTPPMGWNSWNKFAGRVTDQLVRETADAMVSNGMKDAGYQYVNIDDTWEAGRDAAGNPTTNSKFPDMKALADYVHGKGLKIGIYSSPGPITCANYEGSFGHEEQDAKRYAAWGFDYLKYDWCSGSRVFDYHSMKAVYAKMGEALLHSGRPILFSLCQYGVLDGAQWGAKVGGNSWRTTGDISDNWESMSHIGFDQQAGLAVYAGPGHWNDPDMLEIGNGGMTDTEYRTHMSLWSLLAAPLLAGNDLRNVSPATLAILTNKEVIAVDQDRLGKQATRASKDGDLEVWSRPLADGSHAVGLFNRGPQTAKVTARWADLGISGPTQVRDLWAQTGAQSTEQSATDEFSADVPSHGVVLVKLRAGSGTR